MVKIAGGLIIASSVLSLLNLFNILHYVRAIWNIIFGTLMIFLQLNWKKMITRNFGFLNHWFLRGCFYIFVGTNTMTWGSGSNGNATRAKQAHTPPSWLPAPDVCVRACRALASLRR